MVDRRRSERRKVYLSGRLVFNHRWSTVDCLVRSWGEGGARLELPHVVMLPAEMDLMVPVTNRSFRARVAWQGRCELGLAFLEYDPAASVIPIDLAVRIRRLEGERRRLQQRIDQLGG